MGAKEVVRKTIAVVQSNMVLGGGSEACTVRAIEALSPDYDVTLITFSDVDADALNNSYGSELDGETLMIISPPLPRWLKQNRRFSMLKGHLMMRYCKSVCDSYDLMISVGDPMDVGKPSINYVVLAADSTLAKVMSSTSAAPLWYRTAKKTFSWGCQRLSHFSSKAVIANTTLVESGFTAGLLDDMYGIPRSAVVFPPVDIPDSKNPWDQRQNGFLCISRITPGKLVHQVIEILSKVREQGHDVTLRIVGRTDDPAYMEQIQRLCQQNSSWASLAGYVARSDLEALKNSYRYGINAASDEPFGIGVAEMVSSGAIVFVSNGGGQTEIVGIPDLIFDDVDDGAAKIIKVLQAPDLQISLLAGLDQRMKRFSVQTFRRGIKEAADRFLQESDPSTYDPQSPERANAGRASSR